MEESVEGRKKIGISTLVEGIDSQSEKIEVMSDAVVDRRDEARMQDVAQKGRASLALVILAAGFLRVIEGRAKRRRDEAVGGGGEELPERGSWSESRGMGALHSSEQIGQDSIAGDIVCHVSASIVGAHMFLIGALLKESGEDGGIERVAGENGRGS